MKNSNQKAAAFTNKAKDAAKKNVETPAAPATDAAATTPNADESVNTDGLESAAPMTKHTAGDAPQFDDMKFLQTADPAEYHTAVNISSKYDNEREDRIQTGLGVLAKLKIDGVSINPLLILLGRWWEVKPARTAIKKLIDAEAEKLGFTSDVYLQVELAKQIDIFAEVQTAIDRVKYAKTYYKPRKALSNAVITQQVRIGDDVYIVAVQELNKAKEEFKDDKEALRNYIISVSEKQVVEIDEL